MTAWQTIVAIIDAAGPLQLALVERDDASGADKLAQSAQEASAGNNVAPRDRARRGQSSCSSDEVRPGSTPATDVGKAAPSSPDASPQSSDESGFSASSQTGGSAAKKDLRKGAGRAATAKRNRHGAALGEGNGSGGRFVPRDPEKLDRELAFFPLTDLGNAERFRERYRGRLIFCPAIGWLWWDGRRWARDGADERVTIAAHQTVRSIQDEADAIAGTTSDLIVGSKGRKGEETDILYSDTLRVWGRTSESAAKLARLAENAGPYLAVAPGEMDADPYAINLANGTLKVDRAAAGYIGFRAHDAGDLITKISPVVYDPEAIAPRFDQFLAEVQQKPAMQRFLLAWMGYSLAGDVGEQKLVMLYGKGKNGKSVFVEACAHAAGDYSDTVPIETFLDSGRTRNAGQATPDLAILPGVRMLRTSEPDRGAKLSEALIKLVTGGEPVLARHLNRDYFRFYPRFKLTISGNYRPQIVGADDGIWRRVYLVPWTYTVPAGKIDRQLGDKLRAEASGILNRLLDGLRDYLDHGLVAPDDVADATAEYRRDSDPAGRFLEACVVQEVGARVQSSEMHAVFVAWAKVNGVAEWSAKGLSNALTERGLRKKQSDVMWWLDVRLLRGVSDFLDHEGRPLRRTEQDKTAAGTAVSDYEMP